MQDAHGRQTMLQDMQRKTDGNDRTSDEYCRWPAVTGGLHDTIYPAMPAGSRAAYATMEGRPQPEALMQD